MAFTLRVVAPDDDLEAICKQVKPHLWGKDNEMTSYKLENLRSFVADSEHILLLACDGDTIAGISLCYELPHPAGEDSLYIHELDTHPDYRRQGVGTMMLEYLKELAKERGLSELWVGADADNPPAQKLYESQDPYEKEESITYTYRIS